MRPCASAASGKFEFELAKNGMRMKMFREMEAKTIIVRVMKGRQLRKNTKTPETQSSDFWKA